MRFHSVAKHALTAYYDGDADLAGTILDGIASELAEKQRVFVGPREYPGEAERVVRYVAGWHDAANFIDPEVTV